MHKLSKSDQDPHQIERDAEALANMPESQHFEPGTYVVCNNRRGLIRARLAELLTVEWDDGSMSTIKPIALNR